MAKGKAGLQSRIEDGLVNLWVFEDQLRTDAGVLRHAPANARVFMVESYRAFSKWPFHKKRLGFLVSAMRHFAGDLRQAGRAVDYYALNDAPYLDTLAALRKQVQNTGSKRFLVARPSEHHTQAWLDTLPDKLGIELQYVENDLFLTKRDDFADWFNRQRRPVMEMFYRRMRIEHDLLMHDGKPAGGKWNLDHANRKPARSVPRPLPALPTFAPEAVTQKALADIERLFPDHPGTTADFALPVSRADARRALDDFLAHRLPQFGDYEDAMLAGERTLFHSMLSPLLNAGLLEPLAVARAAEEAFLAGRAPINSVEGFIRQIVGWREYVYGVYWTFMPEYRERNTRRSTHTLPDWFWTGDTPMNCLRHAIGDVVATGYAHHIQRLMVICNFSTLAGLSPQEVNDWFYAMFIDSHDWVVTPNVVGMGMNADAAPGHTQGTIATKPYISAAAYINRMSDYCAGCRFDPARRTGEGACPFNYLFWTFLQHFGSDYQTNLRMTMMLKNAQRIDPGEMAQMMALRKQFIDVHVKGRAYQSR
jgi:deoxyribodipyrimidine photolyase-related protein